MKVIALLSCLLVTGCATVRTEYVLVKPPVVHPAAPRAVEWQPVNIVRENTDRYVMDSASRNNLASNLTDVHRYINQQQAVIQFYQKETADDPIRKPVPTAQ